MLLSKGIRILRTKLHEINGENGEIIKEEKPQSEFKTTSGRKI